jgi:hypothetical protein
MRFTCIDDVWNCHRSPAESRDGWEATRSGVRGEAHRWGMRTMWSRNQIMPRRLLPRPVPCRGDSGRLSREPRRRPEETLPAGPGRPRPRNRWRKAPMPAHWPPRHRPPRTRPTPARSDRGRRRQPTVQRPPPPPAGVGRSSLRSGRCSKVARHPPNATSRGVSGTAWPASTQTAKAAADRPIAYPRTSHTRHIRPPRSLKESRLPANQDRP